MSKSILSISAFILIIALSFSFITSDVPKYKNLKVLPKKISKSELDSVMHFFSMSLGQKCNFCHVRNEAEKTMDFASDANPNKNTARQMMRMTAKINKKYFDFREDKKMKLIESVTCYTCHHAQGEPETKPPKGMENEGGKFPGDSTRRDFRPDSSHGFPKDSTMHQH